MQVWKKKTIRYELSGTTVPKDTPKAKRTVIASKRFYGTLRLASGKNKQTPLTEEKATSQALLRRLQDTEDEYRASGVPAHVIESQRPALEVLDEYEAYLRAGACKIEVQASGCAGKLLKGPSLGV